MRSLWACSLLLLGACAPPDPSSSRAEDVAGLDTSEPEPIIVDVGGPTAECFVDFVEPITDTHEWYIWRGTVSGAPVYTRYRTDGPQWHDTVIRWGPADAGGWRAFHADMDRYDGRTGAVDGRQRTEQGRVVEEEETTFDLQLTWDYDDAGRLVATGQPTGDERWSYDERGDVVAYASRRIDGARWDWSATWDEAGRYVGSRVTENDVVSEELAVTAWDEAGRPTGGVREAYVGGAPSSAEDDAWAWDEQGRLVSVRAGNVDERWQWTDEPDGSTTRTNGEDTRTWNAAGHFTGDGDRSGYGVRYTWEGETLRGIRTRDDEITITMTGVCPEAAWKAWDGRFAPVDAYPDMEARNVLQAPPSPEDVSLQRPIGYGRVGF